MILAETLNSAGNYCWTLDIVRSNFRKIRTNIAIIMFRHNVQQLD